MEIELPALNSPRTLAPCIDPFESILQFIIGNHLFEQYCESVVLDKTTRSLLPGFESHTKRHQITISPGLLRVTASTPAGSQLLLDQAKRFLQTTTVQIFAQRERYLLELWAILSGGVLRPHY